MKIKIIKTNPYNVEVGTILYGARRKDGDGSPYPIDAGGWQFKDDEVEILEMSNSDIKKEWCIDKPASLCYCGHTGDGANSNHFDTFQDGHGACKVTGCHCCKFSWKEFLSDFEERLIKHE